MKEHWRSKSFRPVWISPIISSRHTRRTKKKTISHVLRQLLLKFNYCSILLDNAKCAPTELKSINDALKVPDAKRSGHQPGFSGNETDSPWQHEWASLLHIVLNIVHMSDNGPVEWERANWERLWIQTRIQSLFMSLRERERRLDSIEARGVSGEGAQLDRIQCSLPFPQTHK